MTIDFTYEPAAAGIYAIRNRANGRVYVGGDDDVQAAIDRDRFDLRCKSHRNARLQADWNWFGEDSFAFDVVDTIDDGGLARRLDAWRETLRSYGDTGYNARVKVAF